MKKSLLITLGLAVLSGFFCSCKSSPQLKIEGTWNTSAIEIGGEKLPVCESSLIIGKSKNKIYELNGNSGVNSFFGSAKVNGNSFKVLNNMGSTKMLGDPESMEFEKNFTEVLLEAATVKTYSENSDEFLVLETSSGKKKIIFVRVE